MPRKRWSDNSSPDSGNAPKVPRPRPDLVPSTQRIHPSTDLAPRSIREPTGNPHEKPEEIKVNVLPRDYKDLILNSDGKVFVFVTFVPFQEEEGAKTIRSAFSLHRIARKIIANWPDDGEGWPGNLNDIKVQKAHRDEAIGKPKNEASDVTHRPPVPQGHVLIEKDMGSLGKASLYMTSDLNGNLSPKNSSYNLRIDGKEHKGLPGNSNILLSVDCFCKSTPKKIKDVLNMKYDLLTLTDFANEMESRSFKWSEKKLL